MALLTDNQSPTQESLTQGFLDLDTNSDFVFFTWDLLRHSGPQRICTHPRLLWGDLPAQLSPAQVPTPTSAYLEVWEGRMEQSWPQLADLREPFPASVPHQTSVYWVDLWEEVIKACKSSCWRENYLYKQSVIMGFREATYRKGH